MDITLPIVAGGARLEAPPDFRGRPLPAQLVQTFEGRWGWKSTTQLCYVTAASASVLLQPQAQMTDAPEFKALGDAYFGWFRIVQEWASAWSGEPLADFDSSHQSAIHIAASDGYLTASPVLLRTVFIGASPLSRAQLKGAFARASREDRLPVQHRLLLYARNAKLGGDTRQAVIDAATSAEVALGVYVASRLKDKGLKPEFIDEMIKDVNGIMNLHALCTSLGGKPGPSQNRVGHELARVRNEAAHQGKTPSPEVAEIAIGHAEAIVRALHPLPAS
ncbi:hypothetical protein [Kitasatospora cheerisanensis]|uniref:hypothetical protein n=1 Tax=Kitasatospora cheerisanensis TaxID=81942 RepID=UPI0012EEB1AB|nr:hypothetical protein [Kitasatospora cheerisanensis]